MTSVINSSFPDAYFIIAPDSQTNRVVVSVDTLRPEMVSAVGSSGVDQAQVTYRQEPGLAGGMQMAQDPTGQLPITYSRTKYPPYYGGLQASVRRNLDADNIPANDTLIGNCTSGYSFNKGYWGVTAGHCGRSGPETMISIGTTEVGWMGRNRWVFQETADRVVKGDVGRFALAGSSGPLGQGEPKVVTGPKTLRIVVGQFTYDDLDRNTDSCWSGWKNPGPNCGQIKVVGGDIKLTGGGYLENAWCNDSVSIEGDSGGPVYDVTNAVEDEIWAEGIMAGKYEKIGYSCFTHIQTVQELMELTLDYVTLI
ncbi:MAG TPA: hypothetical protein VNE62_03745 [Actinomycetota bacterium]|nr:hypothetical protein [Actinomycetota bacterium]